MQCAICGKEIKRDDREIFQTLLPNEYESNLRHKKCGPGSAAWAKVYNPAPGSIADRLTTKKIANGIKSAEERDIIRHVKEFIGRVKYFKFMDGFNRHSHQYIISTLLEGKDSFLRYNSETPENGVTLVIGDSVSQIEWVDVEPDVVTDVILCRLASTPRS